MTKSVARLFLIFGVVLLVGGLIFGGMNTMNMRLWLAIPLLMIIGGILNLWLINRREKRPQ